jgi:DNA-binding MarR family transcriptional regulator
MQFHQFLIKIYNLHRKKSQASFSDLGLSHGQPRMIEALQTMEGCAQKDLAARYDLEPATVTSVLTNMEKKGYITRTPQVMENGKRVLRVYLTDKGRAKYSGVSQVVNQMEELAFTGFDDAEKQACMQYLERIYINLQK